jgi:hypothetical protein
MVMFSGRTLEADQRVGGKGFQIGWDWARGQKTHGNQLYDTYGVGKPAFTLELVR